MYLSQLTSDRGKSVECQPAYQAADTREEEVVEEVEVEEGVEAEEEGVEEIEDEEPEPFLTEQRRLRE